MDQLPYEILVEIFKRIRRPISFGLTNKLLLKVFTDPDNDLRKRLEKLWAADLPIEVYGELLHEGNRKWNGPDFCLRSNDLEFFHYLTGGNLAIKVAENVLNKNLPEIEDLILNKKFVPNPRKPKTSCKNIIDFIRKQAQLSSSSEQVLKEIVSDGFENAKALNIISRAIIICPYLVSLWNKIGYDLISFDFNDLVLQGNFLILFPPNSFEETVLKHYEIGENPDKIVYQSDENLESLKLFSFDLNIYQWILEKFGTSSTVTSKCLEEIVSTKTYFVNLNNSGNNNSNRNRNNNLSPSTSFSSSEPIRSITLPTCVQASFDGVYEHYCNFYQLNRLMH
ncbi:3468_t:CDS:2 [Entrophospora sp. SA101]|nr:3468_t:CDS:2 [Entrophospora sp. SA101]